MEKLPSQPEQNGIAKKIKQAVTGASIVAASFLPMQEQQASSGETAQTKEITKDMVQEVNPRNYIKRAGATYPDYKEFLTQGEFSPQGSVEYAKESVSILKRLIKEAKEKGLARYESVAISDPERYKKIVEQNQKEIEYMENALVESYATIKDGGRTKYRKLLEEIGGAYQKYDSEKNWVKNNILSDEYRKRLKQEFPGYTEAEINNVLKARIESLDKDYTLVQGGLVSEDAEGDYSLFKNMVRLPSQPSDSTVGVHEFTHQVNAAGLAMSREARELYTTSFDDTEINDDPQNRVVRSSGNSIEEDRLYHVNPTERDARKKELEFEMEKYHIKKYGEAFTDEHYIRLVELLKAGKLSRGSEQFMRLTKPEFMKEIMNTIADSGEGNSIDIPLQA